MLSDEQIDDLLNKLGRQTIGINVREQHRRIVQSWYAAQQSNMANIHEALNRGQSLFLQIACRRDHLQAVINNTTAESYHPPPASERLTLE